MPTIYAVASVKGGVGKTATAANLAATLAAAGYDTVAVDADLGSASLAPTLGVDPGETTLHDVLAGEGDPAEATREGPHGLAVLPGGTTLEDFRKAEPTELVDVIEAITEAEYVVVDTGAGLTHETALPLSVADAVLLVSTPTRDGLANTRKTQDLTERLGGSVAGIALNRADGDEDTGDVDVPVLGSIPEDPAVADAQAAGEPLSIHAPDGEAAAAYRSLASSLTGSPIRPPMDAEDAEDAKDAEDDGPGFDEAEEAEEGDEEPDEHRDTGASEPPTAALDLDPAGSEAAAGEPTDPIAPDDTDPEAEVDDAVIIDDDDGQEDEAAAAARRMVLGEEYVPVEDAESGEAAEIGDDVIPFAQESKERTDIAKQGSDGESDEDEDADDDNGGIFGRLFR
ncbi:MinD/ParA family protein [Halobaculum sp. CBA1158]|uniref:MinD/ParA family ATP-binding protein n=1 Tax=Halobaculum sp. CBA1158 TaxID=2904243 RepID=UPI001F243000|nr:MinD/ParA family protein [Halobaculum sp. CBA1158]UIP00750.1 MinD/ParA family protein [Halobaculum sp. CBA1158]